MTTGRSDRPQSSTSEATEELQKQSGSRFDPHLVKEFLSMLNSGVYDPEHGLPKSDLTEPMEPPARQIPMSVPRDHR
jgi:HD-GYP domain-containing protein (c-di-GMP phosphodiesterase class II)